MHEFPYRGKKGCTGAIVNMIFKDIRHQVPLSVTGTNGKTQHRLIAHIFQLAGYKTDLQHWRYI